MARETLGTCTEMGIERSAAVREALLQCEIEDPQVRSIAQRLRLALAALEDQHDVADVDDVRQQLAEDDDRLALDEAVDQRHQAAADREEPEGKRHDALARALARDPLHQEARGKSELSREAEHQPEIE